MLAVDVTHVTLMSAKQQEQKGKGQRSYDEAACITEQKRHSQRVLVQIQPFFLWNTHYNETNNIHVPAGIERTFLVLLLEVK